MLPQAQRARAPSLPPSLWRMLTRSPSARTRRCPLKNSGALKTLLDFRPHVCVPTAAVTIHQNCGLNHTHLFSNSSEIRSLT